MQLINQFSALMLFAIPVGAFIFWLRLRHRQSTGRWLLLALGVASTAFVVFLMFRFQTGTAGSTSAEVATALDEFANGRPLFIELYSDY